MAQLDRRKVARIFLISTLAAVLLASPLAAWAQDEATPVSPLPPAAVPPYARPLVHSDDETIRGRISSLNGKFGLELLDDRGFVDNVQMHQGTIINPTGISLQPGMSVTIMGHSSGQAFEANQIDTPYRIRPYGYGAPYYPYAYPYFGPYYYPGSPFIFAPRFRFGYGYRGWR